MSDPHTTHVARYRPGEVEAAPDGRLFSPVFHRTNPPITAQLARLFGDASGPVLEIGSGTGQHAAAMSMAFPKLDWWPSDPDEMHRASIVAWAREYRSAERAPLAIDAGGDWAAAAEVRALGPLTAVVSMNVIHIAPWSVAEGIVTGAGKALASGGWLIFYGPFAENGAHTGPGNAAFDARLRVDNSDWGVRDVAEITALAGGVGLAFHRLIEMPANNRLLIYRQPD